MPSHDTSEQIRVVSLNDIYEIYQGSYLILKDFLNKETRFTLTESSCFVRNFSDIGESLTFFREGNPHFNELKDLKYKSWQGEEKDVLSGFISLRNRLIHIHVYQHLLGDESTFEAAFNFAKNHIVNFNIIFQNVVAKLKSENITLVVSEIGSDDFSSTKKATLSISPIALPSSPTQNSSGEIKINPPAYNLSSGKEEVLATNLIEPSENKPSTNNILLSKKLILSEDEKEKKHKQNQKKGKYNILDYLYCAKLEVLDLQKILAECGFRRQTIITEQVLNQAIITYPLLKAALENKAENFNLIMSKVNHLYEKSSGIPWGSKNKIDSQYVSLLSPDAYDYMVSSAKIRIETAHRQKIEIYFPLCEKLLYMQEIKSLFLDKTIQYLTGTVKLVLHKDISDHKAHEQKPIRGNTSNPTFYINSQIGANTLSITPSHESSILLKRSSSPNSVLLQDPESNSKKSKNDTTSISHNYNISSSSSSSSGALTGYPALPLPEQSQATASHKPVTTLKKELLPNPLSPKPEPEIRPPSPGKGRR